MHLDGGKGREKGGKKWAQMARSGPRLRQRLVTAGERRKREGAASKGEGRMIRERREEGEEGWKEDWEREEEREEGVRRERGRERWVTTRRKREGMEKRERGGRKGEGRKERREKMERQEKIKKK